MSTLKRNFKTLASLTALLTLSAALSGCFSFNPRSLREMEAALEASNPDLEVESTMKFGVGPLTMDLVDFAFVHDGSIDLSKISRAEIGVYEVKGKLDVSDFNLPQSKDRSCPRREVIVRVREEHEQVEIAVCIRDDKLTGFTMFVLEPKEIVMINARGDIKSLISSAIRGQGQSGRAGPGRGRDDGSAESEGEDIHEHVDVHVHADVGALASTSPPPS